jgi:hypothetical protein
MATFTWTAQLTTGTLTIGATDKIGLYGASFGDAITVGSYQDSTHIENSGGTHQCSTNHVHNLKYVDSTHFTIDGGGSTLLAAGAPTTAQCPLKINFADAASVATSGAIFWAYDNSTDTNAPTNVTIKAIEQSNTTWGTPAGRASAISLAAQGAATSHDFYIGISNSPAAVGDLTAYAFKIELTYQ